MKSSTAKVFKRIFWITILYGTIRSFTEGYALRYMGKSTSSIIIFAGCLATFLTVSIIAAIAVATSRLEELQQKLNDTKPSQVVDTNDSASNASASATNLKEATPVEVPKDGEWLCAKCGTYNSKSRVSCKNCGTYR